MKKYIVLIVTLLSTSTFSKGYLKYSQPADVFHIVDNLSTQMNNDSNGIIYNHWMNTYQLSAEDKNMLKKFKAVRNNYIPREGEFDRFSLAFYRAKTVDKAMKSLKEFLKKEQLKDVVAVMRHFRVKVSKLISESNEFRGKAANLEKLYGKKKVFKAYEKAMKFFGLKKQYKAKVYFLWYPKDKSTSVEIVQNIIFIKTHPLKNLENEASEKFLLEQMIKSLFSSITKVQRDNFEKTVFPACRKEGFYEAVGLGMGYLPYIKNKDKKKFSSVDKYLDDKKSNLLGILTHHLYTEQGKSKRKFYGEFPNKLAQLCDMIK